MSFSKLDIVNLDISELIEQWGSKLFCFKKQTQSIAVIPSHIGLQMIDFHFWTNHLYQYLMHTWRINESEKTLLQSNF